MQTNRVPFVERDGRLLLVGQGEVVDDVGGSLHQLPVLPQRDDDGILELVMGIRDVLAGRATVPYDPQGIPLHGRDLLRVLRAQHVLLQMLALLRLELLLFRRHFVPALLSTLDFPHHTRFFLFVFF